MSSLALTKSRHLLPFAAALRAQGVGARRLLKQVNLPLNCLDDPDTLIPAVCAGPFRELAAKKTGCPNLSLEATRHLAIENLGNFGRKLLVEPTLRGALNKFRKLVATETSNVVIDLRTQPGGDLWFGQRMLSQVESGEWHSNLYVICWMLKIARLADSAWSPSEILLSAKATQEHFEAIETLGSTARFQQKDTGFLVPASMLALPVARVSAPGKNSAPNLWFTAPSETYAESLQQVIRSYVDDGWLSIEQASEATRTSVRTLQRRLMTEQKTYSDLVQQCRAEMAGDLLENSDATVAEIADQLGYRNQGNFTRAFYRWAKVSPSEFRKQRSPTN